MRATSGSRARITITRHAIRPIGGASKARCPIFWCAAGSATNWRGSMRARSGGARALLFDAWRPRAVQAYFHDRVDAGGTPAPQSRSSTGAALTAEVERYWAAPSGDEDSPAPHATGAAVDLTLALDRRRAAVDGFDLRRRDGAGASRPVRERRDAELSFSDEEARANRRLLHWVMIEEGFAGHPDEWWHFSWGDQIWAALTGAPARALRLGGANVCTYFRIGRNAPSQSAPGGLASK